MSRYIDGTNLRRPPIWAFKGMKNRTDWRNAVTAMSLLLPLDGDWGDDVPQPQHRADVPVEHPDWPVHGTYLGPELAPESTDPGTLNELDSLTKDQRLWLYRLETAFRTSDSMLGIL